MQCVMERAVKLAREGRHRYFMPEHMIYGLTYDVEFFKEYKASGGNIEKLRQDLLTFLNKQAGRTDGENAILTSDTDKVLRMSEGQARASGREAIDVSHLFAAILQLEDCYGVYYLAVQGVDLVEIMGEMSRESLAAERRGIEPEDGLISGEGAPFIEENGERQTRGVRWKAYLEDMNQTCKSKNPLIGRDEEMERTIQILCRKDKNNVLHVGEPGVGKTALAYGLAKRIIEEEVPEPLSGANIYALDLGGLIAGTQYREILRNGSRRLWTGCQVKANPFFI